MLAEGGVGLDPSRPTPLKRTLTTISSGPASILSSMSILIPSHGSLNSSQKRRTSSRPRYSPPSPGKTPAVRHSTSGWIKAMKASTSFRFQAA